MSDFSFGRDNPLDLRFVKQNAPANPLTDEGFGIAGANKQAPSLEPSIAPTFATPVAAPAPIPAPPAPVEAAPLPAKEPVQFRTVTSTSATVSGSPATATEFFARRAAGGAEASFFADSPAYPAFQNAAPPFEATTPAIPAYTAPISTNAAPQPDISILEQAHRALSHEGILHSPGDVLIEAVVLQATIARAIDGNARALADLREGGLQAIKNISANLHGAALEEMATATRELAHKGYISIAPSFARNQPASA